MRTTKVYDILTALRDTNSSNEKRDILIANRDNEWLKQWLYYTYNPYFNYSILGLPEDAWDSVATGTRTENVNELFFGTLDKLRLRSATGNNAKELLIDTCSKLNIEDTELLNLTLNRTIDCGVSVTTINKVWNNLIPVFSIAKANPLEPDTELQFPVRVEQKMNGVRVVIVKHLKSVEIFSSNGNSVPSNRLTMLRRDIDKLSQQSGYNSFVLDGELTSHNRRSVSGIFNKALKNTLTEFEESEAELLYTVFDILPVKVWQSTLESKPASVRVAQIKTLLSEANLDGIKSIKPIEGFTANSMQDIQDYYHHIIHKLNGEGCIVKDLSAPYSFTRNNDWLKMKNISEADLRIVGFTRGTGKREGKIGAITVETYDKKIRVNVGSGLTDKDLEYFTKFQTDLIGRIVTVEYNELIKDKDNQYSLFLPRFVEIRNDKTEADSFAKVKAESNGGEL